MITTTGTAGAAVITVDDSGGADHTTIQSAINAATGGDTITVAAGTYVENVVVNKLVTLQGASNTTTIIDGFGSGNVVEVTVNGVTIDSFRIENGSKGFYVTSDNNVFSYNVIADMQGSTGSTPTVPFSGSGPFNGGAGESSYGFYLLNSDNNELTGNSISNIRGGRGGNGGPDDSAKTYQQGHGGTGGLSSGIYISNSNSNLLSGNTIVNLYGGNGGTGGSTFGTDYGGNGGTGGQSWSIYLSGSQYNNFTGNSISNIRGGTGGTGTGVSWLSGGTGGKSGSIYLLNSNNNDFIGGGNTITGIYAGAGGSGGGTGQNCAGGNGGNSFGILISNSGNNNVRSYTFSTIYAGNGGVAGHHYAASPGDSGVGGYSYGIYLSGTSGNNNITGNTLSTVRGGNGAYGEGSNSVYKPGGAGGQSTGAYISSTATSNNLSGNTISSITGGTGGTGDFGQAGGVGGFSSGLYLTSSNSNDLYNNIISNIRGGTGGTGGSFTDGATGGNSRGIYLLSSTGNMLVNNTLTNAIGGTGGAAGGGGIGNPGPNGNDYGIYLRTSPSNTLYHNYFNSDPNGYDDNTTNSWDNGYPSGGNRWSDYAGVDGNGDGIGDTTYSISGPGGAVDNYPLMDSANPVINSVTINDTLLRTGDPLLVNVSATDGSEITSVTADGLSMTLTGGYYVGTIPAGTSPVTVVVTDDWGNSASDTSATYTIDDDAPVVNSVTLDDYIIRTGTPIEVNVSVSDANAIVTVTADGVSLSLNGGYYTGTILANTGTVTIVSTDEAGNVDTNTSTGYTIDNTKPGTLYLIPPTTDNNSYLSQTFVVTNISVNDANLKNITTYLYYSNGSLAASFTNMSSPAFNNFSGLPQGNYFVNATAWDEAGNYNTSVTYTITLDTTKPGSLEFLAPTPDHYSNLSQDYIVVNITASDIYLKNVTTYLFNSTGAVVAQATNTTVPAENNFTGLPDDVYYTNFTAFDLAGNSNLSGTRMVILDTTLPDNMGIVPPTPDNNSYLSQTYIPTNITAYDIYLKNITTYLYNSTGVLVSSFTNTSPPAVNNFTGLPDDYYFVNATARDWAGNFNTTITRKITLDTTKPGSLEFLAPTPDNDMNLSQTFIPVNMTASDLYLRDVTVYLYDSTGAVVVQVTNTTMPALNNFTGLPEGQYYFNFTAYDLAGNFNVSGTRTLNLDISPPTDLTFHPPMPDNGSYLPVDYIETNVTAQDIYLKNITTQVFSDNNTLVKQSVNTTLPAYNNFTGLADGGYYIRATAYDWAGNSNNTTMNFTIDTIPPVINITIPQGGYSTYASSVFVEGAVNGTGTVPSVSVNGANASVSLYPGRFNGTYNHTVGLSNGFNTIFVEVTDQAGNTNNTSITVIRLKEGTVKRFAGNPDEDPENIEFTDADLQFVYAGSDVSYRFDGTGSIVIYIEFHALASSGLVQSRVDTLYNEPGTADGLPPNIVFGYFDIRVGNSGWATGQNMEDPVVGFRVDRSWISEHNIDPSTVTMYHYADGQWVPLTTVLTGEDGDYLYFEAQTSGFSPFAVTGAMRTSTVVEQTPSAAEPEQAEPSATQPENALPDDDGNMFKLAVILGLAGTYVVFAALRLRNKK